MEEKLYNTKKEKEKFIMVHVEMDRELLTARDSLDELEELIKTSGGVVVGEIIQNLDKINTKHYVGSGKLKEINDLVELHNADGVVCNHELSSVQLRVMGEELNVRVLDRTQIILDIFAGRALSSEGKLQVELAQLKYARGHLSGLGISMSRQGGGIGTRGPGEKKIETDRRLIDDRITDISRELKEVENNRKVIRDSRNKDKMPVVSMVGYTNAGKSTLLNTLTDAGILAEDKLFATLDTTTRKVELPGGSNILYVDTVGFIQKLPHMLIQAFKSTLEELKYADIIIHVVDGTSSIRDEQMTTVYATLKELEVLEKPVITVFNKSDKIFEYPLPIDKKAIETVEVSAKTGEGIDEFKRKIEKVLKSFRKPIEIILPYSEGGLSNNIHEKCEIIQEEFRENGTYFNIYCDDKIYNKVKKYEI